ncbi:ABC transporter substrate-binding protein [Pseudonocardia cypriaca]|uniref:Cellobiose transport system substrate-binding protein n=1 Tax=Pseudonocardia cypriaca TaxID=882449 RepID=A0A543FS98_9PSEU|nr:extracellular solute-binding protein [Pseudonocardia cypriaca]TQM36719.1 cellobiose transport system substrate-binding protein [Pseudonocardia cypriaca]
MRLRTSPPLALLAAAALVVISACSPGSASGGGGDPKSFEFWSFSGIDQQHDVDVYLRDHPDLQVKLTEVGSTTETAQALTTAIAGGKVPDLVLIQGDDMPKFVQQPQNFRDLRESGADQMKGDYLDWVMEQATAEGGQIIGIPTDVGGMAVVYRTDLFAAAGLPTDRESVSKLWPTWDAFIETGKKYVAATGKPFVDNAPTSVFYQAVNQVSQKYYDDAGNLIYDTNPEVKAAFDTTLKALEAGISAKISFGADAWNAALPRGDFAVVSAPAWMLDQIRRAAPDTSGKWDVATIPGGAGNWGGSYLAIPARAQNPEAAWNYIKEMQSPQRQLEHFLDVGSLPTTPAVYDDPKLTGQADPFFSGAPTGQIYTQAVLGIKPFHMGPDTATIGSEFLNALTNVEQGSGNPATAWDDAVNNIRTAIGK